MRHIVSENSFWKSEGFCYNFLCGKTYIELSIVNTIATSWKLGTTICNYEIIPGILYKSTLERDKSLDKSTICEECWKIYV